MLDPAMVAVVRARCEGLVREAEEARPARRAAPARPALRPRVLVGVADRLTGLAQLLRARYEPATYRAERVRD